MNTANVSEMRIGS